MKLSGETLAAREQGTGDRKAPSAPVGAAPRGDRRRGVPILMYHSFGAPGEAAGRYRVPLRRFARQMALLKLLRYRVLRLSELAGLLRAKRAPPPRSVVLTIDDGFADNHRLAFPILRRYGYPASVFVVTGKVGGSCDWTAEPQLSGRALCSWAELREMSENGLEIGGHTRTHPHLTAVSREEARSEIEGCKVDVERQLGRPAEIFAYPHGDCDDVVERLAAAAGFVASCGVRSGLNSAESPPQRLYRTEILGTDSLLVFAAKLRSGSSEAMGSKRR